MGISWQVEGMRHVRGFACFETCETEFGYSKCIWPGSVGGKHCQVRFVNVAKGMEGQCGSTGVKERETGTTDSVARCRPSTFG